MYYTGLDPRTMRPVYVPKTPEQKAMQRALLQWKKPQNRALVLRALQETGREDLIGFDKRCLLRPEGRPPQKKADEEKKGNGAAIRTVRKQSNRPYRKQPAGRGKPAGGKNR